VDQLHVVGGLEGLGDLEHELDALGDGGVLLFDEVVEGAGVVDDLHDEVGHALVLAGALDLDDAGVVELAADLGLAQEALLALALELAEE
jgi:hypothetical protein